MTTTGFKVLNSKPNLKPGFVPQGGQAPAGTGPGLFWAGVGFRVTVTVPPFQRDGIRFRESDYDSGDQNRRITTVFFFHTKSHYIA